MSGYIGSTPVPQATQHRESFTATEGQTSFATAGYTPQFVDVYLNGSHLSPADFTATNGSDVVLGVGASADDVCDIISYTPFEVAGATFTGTTTMTDVVAASLDISGNIDIDGVTNLDVVDIDGAVNMATTALVTGVLTTTAATVFNGGFQSNELGFIIVPDGDADNQYVAKIHNLESTDGRSWGLEIQAGSTAADVSLAIETHDSGTDLLQVAGSGQVRFVDGTASLPAISNLGDLNCGILFPSADAIGFSTAGTENLRLSTTNLSFASGGSAVSASNLVGVSFMIFSGQGQLRVGNSSTSAKNSVEFFNGNGQVGVIVTNGSATAYNTSSDYRLKENVDYDWDATTRLKQLKPARFNFIVDDTNTLVDGFLAHEAQAVVPEAVHGTHNETQTLTKVVLSSSNTVLAEDIEQSDWTAGKSATTDEDGNAVAAIYASDSTWAAEHVVPKMQGIDQSKLVPLLVKTIQELEARITALEA